MKWTIRIVLSFFLSIFIFVFLSCKKENSVQQDDSTYLQLTEDYAFAEHLFSDVFKKIYFAASIDTSFNGILNINNLPINALFKGKFKDSLSVYSVSINNYNFNNVVVSGKEIITNLGKINTVVTFNVIDSFLLTNSAGEKSMLKLNRLLTWTSGSQTVNLYDDIFTSNDFVDTTITKSIVNKFYYKNDTISVSIGASLAITTSTQCDFIQRGIINLAIPKQPLLVQLNFGNNSCNDALYLFNGHTIPFYLK